MSVIGEDVCVHQRLQGTVQYPNVFKQLVVGLRYRGEAPVQKVAEVLLFNIRACHKPVKSCRIRQESGKRFHEEKQGRLQ